MDILLVSQYFPPEMGAPAARAYENARRWVEMGHEVTVLCGVPNHPVGEVYEGYSNRPNQREEIDGINVVRTWVYPTPNRKAWERIANYTSFGLSSLLGAISVGKVDVVIGTSPQLLAGLSGYLIGRLKRVPFVFEVRDLWPESIEASGPTDNSLLLNTLDKISGFLYRRSDSIVVVTNSFKEEISARGISSEKIKVVPNGVDLQFFNPEETKEDGAIGEELKGKFIVSYVGTMGAAHGLNVVLKVAERLEDQLTDLQFLFVGEGAKKEELIEQKKSMGLGNVSFLDRQPKSRIPGILATSELSLVLLKDRKVFRTVIPSKMFESMAMENPVILGVEGEARGVLEEARAGLGIKPESVDELEAAVVEMYQDRKKVVKMGKNGRKYVKENYSRTALARKYLDILEELVQQS